MVSTPLSFGGVVSSDVWLWCKNGVVEGGEGWGEEGDGVLILNVLILNVLILKFKYKVLVIKKSNMLIYII